MAAWPASLPVPQIDGYGYSFKGRVARTPMQIGTARVRRVATTSPTEFNVIWDFTQLQMYIFESWFKLTILDGASWFDVTLHSGGGLISREARFMNDPPYEAVLLGATDYQVKAKLETRTFPLMTSGALAPYL